MTQQIKNAPSLKTHSELVGAAEQAAGHADKRRRSLLHPSPLAPGAFPLQYRVMEGAMVLMSSVLAWPNAVGLSSALGWWWKAVRPFGNVGSRQPLWIGNDGSYFI